jgi:hypothetical protein
MNDRLIENLILLNNLKINTLYIFGIYSLGAAIHETEIKMAEMVEMVEMVEIISTWTLLKVEMAEIMSYYIILIRYK